MDLPENDTSTVKPHPENTPRESFEFQAMANRVNTPPEEPFSFFSPPREPVEQPPPTPPEKPPPPTPQVTYVVQVPKVQIYRVPPPENAHRVSLYQDPGRQKTRRICGLSSYCLKWFLCVILTLLILTAVAGAISYFLLRPKPPEHSIKHVSIKGFEVNRNLTYSPEFIVTVKAQNPNKIIGIYYRKGSSVRVSYSNHPLSNGKLPAFYQSSLNVTVLRTTLTESGASLSSAVRRKLTAQQTKGSVPLVLVLDLPVEYKLGNVKKWMGNVKVRCDVDVDKLTVDSRIVSEECKTTVEVDGG